MVIFFCKSVIPFEIFYVSFVIINKILKRNAFISPGILFKILLTIRNGLAIFIVVVFFLMINLIHPFLARNDPLDSDILVVEGWLPDSALIQSIQEFTNNNYKLLIITGGYQNNYSGVTETSSVVESAATKLLVHGLEEKFLIKVQAPLVKKHRTYNSALALRNWIREYKADVGTINIFTYGVHAKKSQVLYKKALGSNVSVGVISAVPSDYDPKYWFLSITGIHWVLQDFLGYLYALFWEP